MPWWSHGQGSVSRKVLGESEGWCWGWILCVCVCVKPVLLVTVKGLVDQIVGFLNQRVKCCLAQFISLSTMMGWTAVHFQLFFFFFFTLSHVWKDWCSLADNCGAERKWFLKNSWAYTRELIISTALKDTPFTKTGFHQRNHQCSLPSSLRIPCSLLHN